MDKIIADSCCDITPEMRQEMEMISIPLTMNLGGKEFVDDEHLDMANFMDEMRSFSGKSGSAAPSPSLYQRAIEAASNAFIVTLSSKLSASYSNAVIGDKMAKENGKGAAYIFDSQSGSAGETLIVIKIYELIKAGVSRDKIIETVNQFIKGMKTYFVLENYDNLQKNGRLNRITGSLIHLLNIKLIMGSDGNGEIALYEKCRGANRMIQQLLALIDRSGRASQNENLVISHCNNPNLAEQITAFVKERFNFKRIFVVSTGGLSSLYADDQGIVVAF